MKIWWKNLSLRWKISAAFAVLLIANAGFFYHSLMSTGTMNGLVLSLYDNVVMSSTYSQVVKNDFHRYSALVVGRLVAENPGKAGEVAAQIEDAVSTFESDLDVVKKRSLDTSDRVVVDEIRDAFEQLRRNEPSSAAGGRSSASVRGWLENRERLALEVKVSDLTDKIVADGYAFRMSSVDQTRTIRDSSVGFFVAVLLLNLLCLVAISTTIFPRLKKLTRFCADIARGDYSRRVRFRATDELGQLSGALNFMIDALRGSEERIQSQFLMTKMMMDGVGQGFLMIDARGICQPIFSRACLDLLECDPVGKSILDVLRVPADSRDDLTSWIDLLFAEKGDFDELATLGPDVYRHSEGRSIVLEYKPLRDREGKLTNVVLVASDRTAENRARDAAEREHAFSQMVVKLVRDRGEFIRGLTEIRRLIEGLPSADMDTALRLLHTIKGAAATFSMANLKGVTHEQESALLLEPSPERTRQAESAVRQAYCELLSELRINFALNLDASSAPREVPRDQLVAFYRRLLAASSREAVALEFKENFLFESMGELLAPFNSTVSQIADRQGKKVRELRISGARLRVHGEAYADLISSFVHVFRNAVDHGIELPAERVAAGKPEEGNIEVAVQRRDGRLLISMQDDGRGVDVAGLRARLLEKGVDLANISQNDLIQYIFARGVSTTSVTDISGRGIGMDAVLAAARALGGHAWVESEAGRGTTIRVDVPDIDLETGAAACAS